jgi:hypothetical protein
MITPLSLRPEVRSTATTVELFGRALAGAVLPDAVWGGGTALPHQTSVTSGVRIDPERVRRYRELCGFPASSTAVPATFPSLLGFLSALRIMTDRHFPLTALGMVHVADAIDVRRPIEPDEALTVTVRAQDLRPHARGAEVDIIIEVSGDDEPGPPAWREVATYLDRGATVAPPTGQVRAGQPTPSPQWDPPAEATTEELRLPGDLGRAFAGVSGDRNPIHLHPLLAKAFGFPSVIAHGRWEQARSLAAAGVADADVRHIETHFRAPLLLPGRPLLRTWQDGQVTFVWLMSPDGSRTHAATAVTAGA